MNATSPTFVSSPAKSVVLYQTSCDGKAGMQGAASPLPGGLGAVPPQAPHLSPAQQANNLTFGYCY
ncbi:hypothetical protein KDA_41090 [Dictyobacter alpinus]|uniref:Uncharacterized protein n=1 Tax=Dictyobacter alpinus TaxID=2014873 RepID=A0A402BB98_9CHLR|nr:hypothetical protein KDA_41090 [Dictyobacter alpinus]